MSIKIFLMISWMKLMSQFVKKPTQKLTWTTQDYELGRNWAKTQPHPFIKGKSLWDLCYDRYESVNTIDNINKWLFREI
jgi:hypothetical protein